MDSSTTFPVVDVAGPPARRGRQYGAQARVRIHRSITAYERVFAHYAGWDWSTVRQHAGRFARAVDEFAPASLAEIRGIAEGAGVAFEDILALNTRSEIMFAARPGAPPVSECTSFAVLPDRSATGTTVVGQNWDWLLHSAQTATVLRVRRDDGPSFVTLVEAGLLAKVGMNAAGVGLCTNTLISDGEEGRIGVPYHLLLRAVLDSASGAEAVDVISKADRALSANYLVADDTGFAADVETAPRSDGARRIDPEHGQITHANHFRVTELTGEDRYVRNKPHTLVRLRNVTDSLTNLLKPDIDGLKATLADHRDQPSSVCQHPNETVHPRERTATIAGVIMDLSRREFHFASGQPCTAPWQQLADIPQ
ncbi:MAG TPA: C45 family peptidase [Asanoa sp.]|nr:C45 family peptidase [Asanoa sp.]